MKKQCPDAFCGAYSPPEAEACAVCGAKFCQEIPRQETPDERHLRVGAGKAFRPKRE